MSNYTQWRGGDENFWQPCGSTTNTLPPNFYLIHSTMGSPFLTSHKPKTDKAVVVADSISNHIIEQIKRFHEARPTYERFNLLHKRGIMLEGPAGSGKTMSAWIAGRYIVEQGGICVSPSHPGTFEVLPNMLSSIRTVHPNMPIMCILEDIDHVAYKKQIELHLALLDGQYQIDNCFYLATTNHIEEIDERLTNRPKRYDEVLHVGPPSEAARRSYLEQIIPTDQPMRHEAIGAMLKQSDGMMLAHLNELIVAYLVLDHPLDKSCGPPAQDERATQR